MAFEMKRSPNDEKLFHNYKNRGEANIFTLGRGGYFSRCDIIHLEWESKPNILIGRFSSLADGIVFMIGANHSLKSVTTSPIDNGGFVRDIFGKIRSNLHPTPNKRLNPRQIIIGHDVWIGRNAMIMGGVKIGNGAVIGANAVVAKNIPPYAIAVGNPARVVKYRFDAETIKKFLAVKWWNWSLEKIADNFPLMNDVEKFLEAHYSPALEEFPDDEFTQKLNNFVGGGYRTYHFIPDFQANEPLWAKVIQDFKKAKLQNSALVIWLDKDTSDEDTQALTAAIGDNKNILTFKHEENFSAAALRQGTHFITTREISTLAAMDYLWDTDVKIVSALDDGIFKA